MRWVIRRVRNAPYRCECSTSRRHIDTDDIHRPIYGRTDFLGIGGLGEEVHRPHSIAIRRTDQISRRISFELNAHRSTKRPSSSSLIFISTITRFSPLYARYWRSTKEWKILRNPRSLFSAGISGVARSCSMEKLRGSTLVRLILCIGQIWKLISCDRIILDISNASPRLPFPPRPLPLPPRSWSDRSLVLAHSPSSSIARISGEITRRQNSQHYFRE